MEEHLSVDEEVIHQNINILQEQQEESKSTESSKDRPIKKSNINNNEVKMNNEEIMTGVELEIILKAGKITT